MSGQTIHLTLGDLVISDAVTIDADGVPNVTIDAGGASRIFTVDDASVVTDIDVEIAHLRLTGGMTSVQRTEISNNTVDGRYTAGGGLSVQTDAGGKSTISGSTISNNISTSNYSAGSYVGGLRVSNSGTTTITGSTISGNSSTDGAGGLYVYATGGTVNVFHSTITGNVGATGGGIQTSTSGTTLILDHTIVAGNFNATAPDISGTVIARYSLIGDSSGATITDVAGNQIGTGGTPLDPLLGSLADNGGPTPTHTLSPGSLAVDAGSGPVAHYRFEEASGTAASDSVGSNDGTYTNGVSLGQASVLPGLGNAAEFDGVNDFVQLSSPLTVGSSSNSVAVWAKIPEVGSGGLGASERVGVILGNYNSAPNTNWEIDNSGEMRIWWNNGQLDLHGTSDLRDDT